MTAFYICRHGETENNKRGLMSGWIDTPLTDAGKQNALSAAKKLAGIKLDKIISSDMGRAFATAYIIARQLEYTHEIEMQRGLREVNYGDFANHPYSVLPKMPAEEFANYINPKGESLAQMQQRVLACVDKLANKYEGNTVLLAAHDGTINAIHASFTHTNIGVEDAIHHAHDFVAKFTWNSGQITSFDEIF